MSTLSYIVLFYLIVVALLAVCVYIAYIARQVLKVLRSIKFTLMTNDDTWKSTTSTSSVSYTGGEETREPYKIIQKRIPTDKIEDDGDINNS